MESLPSELHTNAAITTAIAEKGASSRPTALATTTRIIPEDRNLGDIAKSYWSNQAGYPPMQQSSEKNSLDIGATSKDQPHHESSLPFDMDVPVAYSIPSSDVVQQSLRWGPTAASGEMILNVPTATTASDADPAIVSTRVTVDTTRLPCPRLCGATFGPNGGLAVFGNGQVKRMWAWYSSSAVASSSSSQHQPLRKSSSTVSGGDKQGLRTMHDLQNMKKAAKDAQWGEQSDGEASSITSHHLGLGFFDDGESDDDSASLPLAAPWYQDLP